METITNTILAIMVTVIDWTATFAIRAVTWAKPDSWSDRTFNIVCIAGSLVSLALLAVWYTRARRRTGNRDAPTVDLPTTVPVPRPPADRGV